ncbi:MAG: phosphoribosyltransferase family protein [Planctomycetia bacterium]|nr:phosphoribosyltransferase family protein [Planctomycetia bacterium]
MNTSILFTPDQIRDQVDLLAGEINQHYAETKEDDKILIVGIMMGAIPFMSDLTRKLVFPLQTDWMRVSSYGNARTPSERVSLRKEPDHDPVNRRVLIVDDIIDTGGSMVFLYDYFRKKGAREIRSAVFLDKKERRKYNIACDHKGFDVPNHFLGGYGMDGPGASMEHLPYIAIVE